ISNTPCFVEEAPQRLLIVLIETQHLQRQYTAQRCRLLHLVDMTIAARPYEANNLVSAHMCSLHQEVAALAIYRIIGVLMSPTSSNIKAPGQLTHLSIPTLV